MGFIKQHTLFSVIIAILVAVFIGELVLAFLGMSATSKASSQFKSQQSAYQSLLRADPSPTEDNLQSVRSNTEELQTQLGSFISTLSTAESGTTGFSGESSDLYFNIVQFKNEYIEHAAKLNETTGADDADDVIAVPEDTFFGFEMYREQGPAAELVDRVYLQRQIIANILDKLYAGVELGSRVRIVDVMREPAGPQEITGNALPDGLFRMPEAISAREEGTIDTLGFRIVFNGHTNNLRALLDSIASDKSWPIVVQSVEVKPAEDIDTSSAEDVRGSADIFSLFGGGAEEASVEETSEKLEIVSNNLSEFTVTFEYFNIIEEDDAVEENPDEQS